jgi:hypothetical protein
MSLGVIVVWPSATHKRGEILLCGSYFMAHDLKTGAAPTCETSLVFYIQTVGSV